MRVMDAQISNRYVKVRGNVSFNNLDVEDFPKAYSKQKQEFTTSGCWGWFKFLTESLIHINAALPPKSPEWR